MKKITNVISAVAVNPLFLVISGGASIAAFLWFLYDKTKETPSLGVSLIFLVTVFCLFIGFIYSLKVRLENIALRDIASLFYEINRIYRDKLGELFFSDHAASTPEELLAAEENALKAVCQRIASIFSRLINRRCMVTVKIITDEGGKLFAHTYVRSQDSCERDLPSRSKYSVGDATNTGFDQALAARPSNTPSYFFSADLQKMEKEGVYSNNRQQYYRFYKSAIVVPIRCGTNDLIGFLCVDTMSTNRLNEKFHLFMVCSLATQMYNFMSLMRGKYKVIIR